MFDHKEVVIWVGKKPQMQLFIPGRCVALRQTFPRLNAVIVLQVQLEKNNCSVKVTYCIEELYRT